MTNPQDIEALKSMTTGERWVWLAGQLDVINDRLGRLERKRWNWILGGGATTAGIGGAATLVLRLLNIL